MIEIGIFVVIVMFGAAVYKLAEGASGRMGRNNGPNASEVAREIARLHERLDRMEERMRNVETIVVDREKEARFSVLNDSE